MSQLVCASVEYVIISIWPSLTDIASMCQYVTEWDFVFGGLVLSVQATDNSATSPDSEACIKPQVKEMEQPPDHIHLSWLSLAVIIDHVSFGGTA